MASQLVDYAAQFESLLRAVLFVIGAVMIIQALRLAVRRAEAGSQSVSLVKILVNCIIGVALLAFPHTVAALVATIFGSPTLSDASSLFAFGGAMLDPLQGSRPAIEAIVVLIQFIGFIAIARGLLFLSSAASPGGPKTFGPGFTFLISGALAVNFPAFFGILTNLFALPG